MTRKCFGCSNDATNDSSATIAVCDNCWSGIQDSIVKAAKKPGNTEPLLFDPKIYRWVEFLGKRKSKK